MLDCDYIQGGIFRKQVGGCKADFERVVGVSEKNRVFRKWLDFLIEKRILVFFEKRKAIGGFIDTYVIVYPKMEKMLTENPVYDPTMNYVKRRNFVLRK